MNQSDLLFEDDEEEEEEEEEPEIITYRANFSRTVYGTEYTSVTFEAQEGLTGEEIDSIAWRELNAGRYQDWSAGDYWDSGDPELDEVEEE
jgi:hypothetical protein